MSRKSERLKNTSENRYTRKKTSEDVLLSVNDNSDPTVKKKSKLDQEDDDITLIDVCKLKRPPCQILNYYKNYQLGFPCHIHKKAVKDIVINYCRNFKLHKLESPFDRRVTYIVWHPTNPRVLSVTSHGGDIVLYNYEEGMDKACLIKGIGAGGSVQGMKFDPQNPLQIYTVSMEGKFLVLNFQTKEAKQFLETNDINRWYVSVDVNANNNTMVAGDTRGSLTVLTIQGEVTDRIQLHKKGFKVNHVEFSKRESWLLCTSSTDGSMKLWDIRCLKSGPDKIAQPLQKIVHQKPINAAYFSLTDGCRLLTTDQYDKIHIYRAPLWNLETVISHPHRQFQHLTPIKAYWHPLEDIIFVGRYPHEKFPDYHKNELRTIDFFDAETGKLLYQHFQNGVNGILSLNRFNIIGDALASSYGNRFMIWKPNYKYMESMAKRLDAIERNDKEANITFSEFDIDDEDEINWDAVLKTKSKEKAKEKKLTKTKVKDG